MNDPRHDELARLLVEHSLKLQPGENCLVQTLDVPVEMVNAMVRAVSAAGANPVVNMTSERVQRTLAAHGTDDTFRLLAETEVHRMKKMDAYIGMRALVNEREMGDVAADRRNAFDTLYLDPVHFGVRIPDTRWVVLRYPTPTMAYAAGMSFEAFEDFFYRVSSGVDYVKMARAMEPAVEFLKGAENVHITAPGTDLSFSIEGMPAVPCAGDANVPDGEVYTVPVKDSVHGTIRYNTASTYNGFTFADVSFRFKDGRIVEATANDTERLNNTLDSDEGARFIGEFALGCNPWIETPMDNTLFDEKIAGSIHFTPGNAYEDCDNGNRSTVHWDLVLIMRPEWGGGVVEIDGEPVSRDGRFVHPAFAGLNPENLAT